MLIREQIECRDYCHVFLIAPIVGHYYTSKMGIAHSAQYNDSHSSCRDESLHGDGSRNLLHGRLSANRDENQGYDHMIRALRIKI